MHAEVRQHSQQQQRRQGYEVVACGLGFPCAARVVTWREEGGLDGYRAPEPHTNGEHAQTFGRRREGGQEVEALPSGRECRVLCEERKHEALRVLRQRVQQMVLHYDGCGTAQRCFRVLHDERRLSAHFIVDVDGTIYQTLDAVERAWHATVANDASVGVEIANAGAWPRSEEERKEGRLPARLQAWYERSSSSSGEGDDRYRLLMPPGEVPACASLPPFEPPEQLALCHGEVHGTPLVQVAFTEAQVGALAALGAALQTALPLLSAEFPRDPSGKPSWRQLEAQALKAHRGMLGHFHVQTNKVDPGPALPWCRVASLWRTAYDALLEGASVTAAEATALHVENTSCDEEGGDENCTMP